MHVKIYKQQFVGPNPGDYTLVQLRVYDNLKSYHLLMNRTKSHSNSEIWRRMTGTRLDLL